MGKPLTWSGVLSLVMKKFALAIMLLLSYGFAETWDVMPPNSPQYKAAQKVISSIYGYEEPCPEITSESSEKTAAREKEMYKVSQTICGGYFILDEPPLREIDEALNDYTSEQAWQRLTEGYYRKVYELRLGELIVAFNEFREFDNEASLFISYYEQK